MGVPFTATSVWLTYSLVWGWGTVIVEYTWVSPLLHLALQFKKRYYKQHLTLHF